MSNYTYEARAAMALEKIVEQLEKLNRKLEDLSTTDNKLDVHVHGTIGTYNE